MKLETFFKNFALLTNAPNAANKLRELVLQLAVRGKLVAQDPDDELAQILFKSIQDSKESIYSEKKIRPKKSYLPLDPEEIPFEIPVSWQWVKLHEICWLITDGTHHTPQYVETGVPFLSVKDLSKGYIDFSNTRFITHDAHIELCNRCQPEYGDILLTKVGTTGIAVEIDTKEEFSIFVSVALLKHFRKFTFPIFLRYLLNSPLVKAQSEAGTEGVGNKNLVLRKIYNFVLPLPPLAEQRRIVEACDRILALCDKIDQRQQQRHEKLLKMNEVAIAKLLTTQTPDEFDTHWRNLWQNFDLLYSIPETIPKLRQAILQLAVQGKLVEQDPDDELAKSLLKKIKAEKEKLVEQGKIKKSKKLCPIPEEVQEFPVPKSWEWTHLQNIFLVITDGDHQPPPKTDSGIPFLVIGNVRHGYLNFEGSRFVSEEYFLALDETRTPRKGNILYTVVGSYGIPVIVDTDQSFCVQRHIAILKPSKFMDVEFLKYLLESRLIFDQATQCATGIAQKTVPLNGLRSLIIPLPPLAEQKRIVAKVDRLMALCDALETKLTTARAKRETLMEAAARQVLAA